MKVYVIKEKSTWRYFTETRDFINDLRQAELFFDYEVAQAYCPSCCEVVEVQLMETKDLADYTKQVRKEVVQELKEKLKSKEVFHPEDEFTIDYDFYYKEDVEDVLNEIQGESK